MNSFDGEELYKLYQEELDKLGVSTDAFGDLDAVDQTAWHCVAFKLEKKDEPQDY